jgi:putative SOS response-associated peptidase YedK
MCGRVALYSPPIRLAKLLDATLAAGIDPEGVPSWNLGPQRQLFGVTETPEGRRLDTYLWGLVPAWAKDVGIAAHTVNARCETIREKPSFREAYRRHPVAIPVDGFFEWEVLPARKKQPHYFLRRDEAPMVLAGIFEHWRDPALEAGPTLTTCTIITSEPGVDIDGLHDRMPVVLELNDVERWLTGAPDDRYELLRPAPAGTIRHYPVDVAVGSVRNDNPSLITPTTRHSLF